MLEASLALLQSTKISTKLNFYFVSDFKRISQDLCNVIIITLVFNSICVVLDLPDSGELKGKTFLDLTKLNEFSDEFELLLSFREFPGMIKLEVFRWMLDMKEL